MKSEMTKFWEFILVTMATGQIQIQANYSKWLDERVATHQRSPFTKKSRWNFIIILFRDKLT